MHFETTPRFEKDYHALPAELKERVKKTLELLQKDPSHPSLHHKKMQGYTDVFEARITYSYRLTYQKIGDIGYLRRVGSHDILRHP
jgi:mRNA-degrading endonuclease YafQ of YafQ-DinJ toxin-antitoxin module